MKQDLTAAQHMAAAKAALQALLDNIPSSSTAAAAPTAALTASTSAVKGGAAAAGPAGADGLTKKLTVKTGDTAAAGGNSTQAELIAAERRMRSSAAALRLTFEQQLQLRQLVGQLLLSDPQQLQVQLFLTEYEVSTLLTVLTKSALRCAACRYSQAQRYRNRHNLLHVLQKALQEGGMQQWLLVWRT
jgi:hypothetical protein